jgi:hypothetical protein
MARKHFANQLYLAKRLHINMLFYVGELIFTELPKGFCLYFCFITNGPINENCGDAFVVRPL